MLSHLTRCREINRRQVHLQWSVCKEQHVLDAAIAFRLKNKQSVGQITYRANKKKPLCKIISGIEIYFNFFWTVFSLIGYFLCFVYFYFFYGNGFVGLWKEVQAPFLLFLDKKYWCLVFVWFIQFMNIFFNFIFWIYPFKIEIVFPRWLISTCQEFHCCVRFLIRIRNYLQSKIEKSKSFSPNFNKFYLLKCRIKKVLWCSIQVQWTYPLEKTGSNPSHAKVKSVESMNKYLKG